MKQSTRVVFALLTGICIAGSTGFATGQIDTDPQKMIPPTNGTIFTNSPLNPNDSAKINDPALEF